MFIFHFIKNRDVIYPSHWLILKSRWFFLSTNQKWFPQFDVSPSPESGLCLRAGIDLPQCLNTWPHTGAQYDLRTLDVFEHLGHYARRLWKARAARAIFPFARSNFFRRGWWSIHELGSIYPILDGWQLSLFLFKKSHGPGWAVFKTPVAWWFYGILRSGSITIQNRRMNNRSTEQKHAKNPQFGSEISASLGFFWGVPWRHKIVWFNASTLLEQFCAFPISLHILDHPTPPRNFVP